MLHQKTPKLSSAHKSDPDAPGGDILFKSIFSNSSSICCKGINLVINSLIKGGRCDHQCLGITILEARRKKSNRPFFMVEIDPEISKSSAMSGVVGILGPLTCSYIVQTKKAEKGMTIRHVQSPFFHSTNIFLRWITIVGVNHVF